MLSLNEKLSNNLRQKPWNTLNILAPLPSPSLLQCCCSQWNTEMSSQLCTGERGVSRIFGEDCNLRQKPWNTLNILAPLPSPSLLQCCCSQWNTEMSSQLCTGERGVSRIFGEDWRFNFYAYDLSCIESILFAKVNLTHKLRDTGNQPLVTRTLQ